MKFRTEVPYLSGLQRRRRRNALLISAAAVLVLLALVVFAERFDSGKRSDAAPAGITSSGTRTSTGGGTTSIHGLPPITTLGTARTTLAKLRNSTRLETLSPGVHHVTVTARSNTGMLAVAYSVKGERSGKVYYNVGSPVVITRTLNGHRPYIALTMQMGPNATYGSCSVRIDGKIVDQHSDHRGYAVIGCVG